MLKRYLPVLIFASLLFLALSGCLPFPRGEEVTQEMIETAAFATVSAQQTRVAFDELVVELTRIAQATTPEVPAGATPTHTPAGQQPAATATPTLFVPTNTPFPTATLVPPTPTPLPCLAARFVSDVTIPDGTVMKPNQAFIKTWRLRNAGSCTWTTDFDLIFMGGNALGAPAAIDIVNAVRPGEQADFSVSMVAPATPGTYRSNWQLRNGAGTVFGLGPAGDKPFWAEIKVEEFSGAWDPAKMLDFAHNFCQAEWRTGVDFLGCPSTGSNFDNGSVVRSSSPRLEGGYQDNEPAIIVIPNKGDSGYISGRFPSFTVKSGDRFTGLIGCMHDTPKCDVTFELLYKVIDGGETGKLGEWHEVNDGKWTSLDVDLNFLADKKVEITLRVKNNGSNQDDRVFWLAPIIKR
ncbi:MAG: NBR1-Ig-like domain-containing protein [Anaerolineaceae bacterium]|jgi:hypothetical protein